MIGSDLFPRLFGKGGLGSYRCILSPCVLLALWQALPRPTLQQQQQQKKDMSGATSAEALGANGLEAAPYSGWLMVKFKGRFSKKQKFFLKSSARSIEAFVRDSAQGGELVLVSALVAPTAGFRAQRKGRSADGPSRLVVRGRNAQWRITGDHAELDALHASLRATDAPLEAEMNATDGDSPIAIAGTEAEEVTPEQITTLLHGGLDHGLRAPQTALALFISSTFTDTEHERNGMIGQLPALKALARSLSLDLEFSEMRWGVTPILSAHHQTTALCLQELRRCQAKSPSLNFVSLLGDKYGFRPFPNLIAASDFERLVPLVRSSTTQELLRAWFREDANAVPAMMVLLPIHERLPEYLGSQDAAARRAASNAWWAQFEEMQGALRQAALDLQTQDETFNARPFLISVTEDEVQTQLEETADAGQCSVWYRRCFSDLAQVPPSDRCLKRYVDMTADGRDHDAQTLLAGLHQRMMAALPHIHTYPLTYHPDEGVHPAQPAHQQYLEQLCTDFEQLVTGALHQLNKSIAPHQRDPLLLEVAAHLQFAARRGVNLVGRDTELQSIKAFLTAPSHGPLVVVGDSGSGKTSVMANAVASAAVERESGTMVIARFVGVTPASRTAQSLMHSICEQIMRTGRWAPKGEGNAPEALESSSAETPLIVAIDSLDQLSESSNGRSLAWLPIVLPPHTHLIVSTLPQAQYKCLPSLESAAARARASNTEFELQKLTVLPLNATQCLEACIIWLRMEQRCISEAQRARLQAAFEQLSTPLYMRVALQLARHWFSYTEVAALPATARDAINVLFEEFEKEQGEIVVRRLVGYFTATVGGVSSGEMLDVLSCDDEVLNHVFEWWLPPRRLFPPLIWTRFRTLFAPFLTSSTVDGAEMISWHHRQFWEAAEARYLATAEDRRLCHAAWADYFCGHWHGRPKPFHYTQAQLSRFEETIVETEGSDRFDAYKQGVAAEQFRDVLDQPIFWPQNGTPNRRRATQQAHHLLAAGRFEEVARDILLNFEALQAKVQAQSVWDVLREAELVLAESLDAGLKRSVQLLLEFLTLKSVDLNSSPRTLPGLLHNHIGLKQLQERGETVMEMARLLQAAATYAREHQLLLPNYAAGTLVGGPLHQVFPLPFSKRQSVPVTSIRLSSSRDTLYASYNNKFSTFDLASGALVGELELFRHARCQLCEPQQRVIMSHHNIHVEGQGYQRLESGRIVCLELATGRECWARELAQFHELVGVNEQAGQVIFQDGQRIVFVQIEDAQEIVSQDLDEEQKLTAVACNDDGTFLSMALETPVADGDDALPSTAVSVLQLQQHSVILNLVLTDSVKSLAFADQDRILCIATSAGWRAVEVASGATVSSSSTGALKALVGSQSHLCGLLRNNKACLADVRTGQEVRQFQCGMMPVTAMNLLSDPFLCTTAGYDGQVRFWLNRDELALDPTLHHNEMPRKLFHTQHHLISWASEPCIKAWSRPGLAHYTDLKLAEAPADACALPNDQVLVAIRDNLLIWDLPTKNCVYQRAMPRQVASLSAQIRPAEAAGAEGPEGQVIVIVSFRQGEGGAQVWDLAAEMAVQEHLQKVNPLQLKQANADEVAALPLPETENGRPALAPALVERATQDPWLRHACFAKDRLNISQWCTAHFPHLLADLDTSRAEVAVNNRHAVMADRSGHIVVHGWDLEAPVTGTHPFTNAHETYNSLRVQVNDRVVVLTYINAVLIYDLYSLALLRETKTEGPYIVGVDACGPDLFVLQFLGGIVSVMNEEGEILLTEASPSGLPFDFQIAGPFLVGRQLRRAAVFERSSTGQFREVADFLAGGWLPVFEAMWVEAEAEKNDEQVAKLEVFTITVEGQVIPLTLLAPANENATAVSMA
ncbi:uncharacterized protein MONBRDRAFT_32133 [Monosiga brevicollis MX1]|uniref:NACHT domain-containing protein n=1 Tax=Monosiga brevicollis TaxID=81824 RepID=A9UXU9_MONBE|nr:uncharacterized protein MONBRDRAFT_32133 [Monosiga brevicollis MX1]EDQ89748.1 predicted protein [Monosiga brevicollis MX1]|eukprot:XP_001745170.1 hypothetical protein [Monosiga brevicollis MX1]